MGCCHRSWHDFHRRCLLEMVWIMLRSCAILGELHVVGFVTLFLSGHDRHAYLELILQREKHISLLRCEPNPIEAFTFSPFCGCGVQIVFLRDSCGARRDVPVGFLLPSGDWNCAQHGAAVTYVRCIASSLSEDAPFTLRKTQCPSAFPTSTTVRHWLVITYSMFVLL